MVALYKLAPTWCKKRALLQSDESAICKLLKLQAEQSAKDLAVQNKILEKIAQNTRAAKDKLSNMELRQIWDNESDVQRATRRVQNWATGASANISPSHLEILMSALQARDGGG